MHWTKTAATRDEKYFRFVIWCGLIRGSAVYETWLFAPFTVSVIFMGHTMSIACQTYPVKLFVKLAKTYIMSILFLGVIDMSLDEKKNNKQDINRDYLQNHNNDVERLTWCLNSGVFVQYVVQADNKQPINLHSVMPLLWESTGDRCIPSNDSPNKASVIKKPRNRFSVTLKKYCCTLSAGNKGRQ